jgi:hypothetical protein
MLASSGFAQSPRMRRFLGFVVSCSRNGETNRLKDSIIGVEVFDRAPSYDPKAEPIVRTEAHRLREKIREYYEGEGINDRVVISLPKGGYAARVERSERPNLGGSWRSSVLRLRNRSNGRPNARLRAGSYGGELLSWWPARQSPRAMLLNRKPPGAPTLTPLTSLPGHTFRRRFSPDGQRVAFVWDGEFTVIL